jgi:predicted dehydrogenase
MSDSKAIAINDDAAHNTCQLPMAATGTYHIYAWEHDDIPIFSPVDSVWTTGPSPTVTVGTSQSNISSSPSSSQSNILSDEYGWHQLRIPLGDVRLFQHGRGLYGVEFKYRDGAHRLDICSVALRVCPSDTNSNSNADSNTKVSADSNFDHSELICADHHAGTAGLVHSHSTYTIDLTDEAVFQKVTSAAPTSTSSTFGSATSRVYIEAMVRCNGGTHSQGEVHWMKLSECDSGRPVRIVVVGCGERGTAYAEYALDFPHLVEVVAAVDPRASKRRKMKKVFGAGSNFRGTYASWEDVAAMDKFADAVVVATPDRLHAEPAIALALKGYHILLEKPMAITRDDCAAIADAVSKAGVLFAVCHVLRYTPCNRKIKQLLESGAIGDVVNITHTEPVGFFHFAHSYVRGNWHSESKSTFSLMAKCCHDVDLVKYWMNADCSRVSSFGSLQHFRKASKPADAKDATRCLDCTYESQCPYSAKRIYLDPVKRGYQGWPVRVIVDDVPDVENVTDELQNGAYGKCVYESENDVCDNQIVQMQFDDGQTATVNMIAFTEKLCERHTKIYGTRGELTCVDGEEIRIFDFLTQTTQHYGPFLPPKSTRVLGHGGADFHLMDAFVRAVSSGDASHISTGANDALASHNLVFDAEHARRTGSVHEYN